MMSLRGVLNPRHEKYEPYILLYVNRLVQESERVDPDNPGPELDHGISDRAVEEVKEVSLLLSLLF
jgi:hypothetical protein